ncbi:ketopantoate reductase [Melghiribacillus thermohalophilus]|uniref:2-dehydropantoate 2-reductase n=1 Tax=Melghiribacillus thermohalophilus TaxID=1324956 RepID=A0A4V2V2W7_9BACI|nr:2-dehydropantoate 2-reductase [Melghiribacillus thermohalophilus]TCT26881.1 ketopantoate reductase [Melghiribacillus thermohalophilus]
MNIGVVGAGSIGLLLSARLAQRSHHIVCYVQREDQKRELNQWGIHLLPEKVRLPVQAKRTEQMTDHDLVIVSVKQPQIHPVIDVIKQTLSPDTPLLFLQNGMSHLEQVQRLKQPIWIGVVEHGAIRLNDHTVRHTGLGVIRAGTLRKQDQHSMKNRLNMLNDDRFPFVYEEDWERMVKQKLAVNAVINPLTALFRVKNGDIMLNSHIKKLGKHLCYEACDVLGLDRDTMWEMVVRIARATSKNESSMLTDIEKGHETEIDSISGYLLKSHELDLPYTRFVYHAVKAIELKNQEEDDT